MANDKSAEFQVAVDLTKENERLRAAVTTTANANVELRAEAEQLRQELADAKILADAWVAQCNRAERAEAALATARAELLAIHEIIMCIAECPPIADTDTYTVKAVKELSHAWLANERAMRERAVWCRAGVLQPCSWPKCECGKGQEGGKPLFPEWCECPPDKRSRRVPYLGVPRCTVCGGKCP